MKKLVLFVLLTVFIEPIFAYSQCTFDINNIYLGTDDGGSELIYISLIKPTGGIVAINKNKNNALSSEHLNRIYSTVLTAFTAGKKIIVRYPEDNLDCSTLSGNRSDFIGITLIN